ncbi:MAG: DNA/RNA non-specific endonuclease [Eggerthellaceae bacterium]|nr:DNA/RNA non-specific endonuclease [Eggerthellaceae bacterium]
MDHAVAQKRPGKSRMVWRLAVLALAMTVGLSACAEHDGRLGSDAAHVGSDGKVVSATSEASSQQGESDADAHVSNAQSEGEQATTSDRTSSAAESHEADPSSDTNTEDAADASAAGMFSLDDVPAYHGSLSVDVNGSQPFFTDEDRTRGPFETYSPFDDLGRTGAAFALINRDTMPTEERNDNLSYNPTGWQVATYDWVDQRFLYNRCHLIAWSLAGEGDNPQNLITGTRTLNMEGMRRFEEQVSSYVYRTSNSVLFRVTPLYRGSDLVAEGVLMEAESVEDNGTGLRFCVFCYNVEPGVEIDYATGANRADGSRQAQPYEPSEEELQADFVINKSSKVYHYPDCDSVIDMRAHNKIFFQGTLEELEELYPFSDGWHLCKKCRERHAH